MKRSTKTLLLTLATMAFASYQSDLAAIYVAFIGGSIFYRLYVIDTKLDRLLRHHKLSVHVEDVP
jgi:hypothetical protein